MLRVAFAALAVCMCASTSWAQSSNQSSAPPVRRWIDVQNLQLTSRFRWVKSNDGRITSSTHQWQPTLRARVLLDRAARYTIHVGAFGGSHFVSGWNNTGAGLGDFTGDFNVKQLFVAVEPRAGLEIQAGGLYPLRGENTEITSYDNDAYIVGERVSVRRGAGKLSQIATTVGHIGDYRTPNVFRRLDSLADINYGQLLVAARLHERLSLSADYTYEDGRDYLREGFTLRMPDGGAPLTAVRLDSYQRVSSDAAAGFNLAADFRFWRALSVTAGIAHVDRGYVIPGYMSPNADRFERGTRFYSIGTYTLTRALSVGWFQGRAFNVDYPIPNKHRWELLVTINPTATLRAHGIF